MALPVIETPKYELTLPSTGEKVEYRPYLVKEEKILLMALESKETKGMMRGIRDVVEACTFGKIDVDKIRLYDLEYIFLQLRTASVGANSSIKIACNSCSHDNENTVNLSEIEVKGDHKDYTVEITDKVGVVMRPPSVRSALINSVDSEEYYDVLLNAIVSCIDSIYDEESVYAAGDHTKEELINFVESLSQEHFQKMSAFFESLPAIKHTFEFDCANCGTHNSKEIRGMANFF